MWFKKIGTAIARWWRGVSPEILHFVEVMGSAITPVLLSVASQAVVSAASQKGLSGQERFDFAVNYTQEHAQEKIIEAAINAVRIEYVNKTGKLSKY